MNPNRQFFFLLPIIFALLIIAGIFIGIKINSGDVLSGFMSKKTKGSQLDEILNYIEKEYVDTISKKKLVEKTLRQILMNLDPHSAYISKEELKFVNESLKGNFKGIGIEFNIIKDTLRVIAPVSGGPSEVVGIKAGDMIVKVEGKNIAGIKITNEEIIKTLRGEEGTKVTISVKRRGLKELLIFTITRGEIPVHSVDVAYMTDKTTGYLKLSRFGEKTYSEFMEESNKLLSKGMKKFILDLRGNPGGYMDAAIAIADEFLENGKKIVYTKGKNQRRKDYLATSTGKLEKLELIVLIDEGSASASEIVAGALQDNDKGIIIGRRSFGKGLVQNQFELPDSSAIRLTIARYYTPTGRSIQKPYTAGTEEYYKEEPGRYKNGEVYHQDSIKFPDSLRYITPKGNIVYGGGGIMPDIYVPLDTTGQNSFLAKLMAEGIINQFAYDYSDRERLALKSMGDAAAFGKKFNISDKLFSDFIHSLSGSGIQYTDRQLRASEKIIRIQLKAIIARNIYGMEGFSRNIIEIDNIYKAALKTNPIPVSAQ